MTQTNEFYRGVYNETHNTSNKYIISYSLTICTYTKSYSLLLAFH